VIDVSTGRVLPNHCACKNGVTTQEQATIIMQQELQERNAGHASAADEGIYALI
jgi:hypothetical protein